MASVHSSETNFEVAKSVISSSSPQSKENPCDSELVQFICSYGGQILPRRHNANELCYIGGSTHILSVDRCTTFSSLLTKLSNLAGSTEISVKYHLPDEDLDELISVTMDEDVENMMIVSHRLICNVPHGSARFLRLFLFTKGLSDVLSHTNSSQSDQEEYQHQEVPPLVTEQNFSNCEQLQQETIACTDIPLLSGRAIPCVSRPVTYKRLKTSDTQKQPEFESETESDDSSADEPVEHWDEYDVPDAIQKNLKYLWQSLNDKDVHTIKIEGESGTGKAWMVRQIIDRARASNLFDIIIWAADSSADIVDISRGWELIVNGLIRSGVNVDSAGASWCTTDTFNALQERRYLLVLEQLYAYSFSDLGIPHPRYQRNFSKLVFVGSPSKNFYVDIDNVYRLEALPQIEARLLFENRTRLRLDDPEVCKFGQPLLQKCNGNLSMILVLAESLRRNFEESPTKLRTIDTLQKAYDLLIHLSMPIVEVICEILPSKQVRDCFLYFLLYFSVRKPKDPINVVRLIAFWILEGCLDGFNCFADAYKRGQEILVELMGSCLLIRHDDEHVTAQSCTLSENNDTINKNVHSKVLQTTNFRNLTPFFLMNEKLVTECSDISERDDPKVLLVYGNEARAPHEIPDVFFEEMENLHILSFQHTGIKSLPSSLSTLESLNTLILRDCSSLEDVNQIREIPSLKYLDLSSARSLNKLPDNFFQNMKHLQHLDLSHSQLKKLPSSFYNLTTLQSLILEGCSRLQLFLERFSSCNLSGLKYLILSGCSQIQTMPHPDAFPNIEVFDLSGASSFNEFYGESRETYRHFRKIDLSGTRVVDVHFLSRCVHLEVLLLKNCSKIETVPSLSRKIEILDLSGSISFKKFEDESLGDKLLLLDLSRTQIEKLPVFSIDSRLSQLLLRECANLEKLPPWVFQKLEMLDLSGSIEFKKFNDVSSRKLCRLKTLDLSATQITELPNLSECSHLQQLVLRNCPGLVMLPQLKELTELKVLDLSGSSAIRKLQDTDMEKKVKLEDLNLSGTQVVRIPSLDECHDLQKLILRGCSKLESLPHLEALSRLQVLDLSGSVSFTTFQDQSLGSKCDLQLLDLSETQVTELPLLTGCSNLCHLSVRDCSKLKNLPPFGKPTRLEVLDLSGTKNLDLSVLSECQNLRQLSLRGCSNLDAVPFEYMHSLEKVDFSGTSIQKLPSRFSGYGNLIHLVLKECSNLKMLPQPVSFNNLEVLDISCQQDEESSSGISVSTHLRCLVTLNKNFLWEFDYGKDFEKFHFILCSLKDWGKEKHNYLRRREVVFRDIYYQTNNIPWLTKEVPDKFFKICGFLNIPSCAEKVLVHAELLYVENNDFMTRLSDVGAKHVKVVKDCWIESCQNIESCFYGEEGEENDALGKCLQNLWVSKLPNLKCLFRDVVNSKSFTCLKNLYIECCPNLVTLFSSHLELKNLETLKVKFCDKLENVSGDMLLTEQTFPMLKILTLWKLPKLHRVCTGALPSLEYLAVKRCPNLVKLPLILNSTSHSLKIKGEKQWWDNLKCEDDTIKFHISFTEFPQFL